MRLPRARSRGARVTALGVAVLTVAAAAAGIARSTSGEPIPDAQGVIHACYKKPIGPVRVVYDETNCNRGEIPIQWNQTGVQGPRGETGPQGPQGPPGAAAAGVEVIEVGEFPVDSNGQRVVTPQCATGKRPIAGLWKGFAGIRVPTNQPHGGNPELWFFEAENIAPTQQAVHLYLACIDFPFGP